MDRLVERILVLVLGVSVVAAEDEGQDKRPTTPEQQYKALLKQYNDALQDYAKSFGEAAPCTRETSVTKSGAWPASSWLAWILSAVVAGL